MSDVRPLVLEEGLLQRMQPWHTIDEDTLPPKIDETRMLVRLLVVYLCEQGFGDIPEALLIDAFSDETESRVPNETET
jgi:hypothetical protein